jgi:outer membrane receptor protein involved in Fe transport
VQAGFQLPDWSRRGFYDRTNFGGTFFFANLDAFNAGRPYAFTQQQGNGDLAFLEKQVGAYVKDDWQARPGLSISYGLRYDWQNYFHDNNNFAPRALGRVRAWQQERRTSSAPGLACSTTEAARWSLPTCCTRCPAA